MNHQKFQPRNPGPVRWGSFIHQPFPTLSPVHIEPRPAQANPCLSFAFSTDARNPSTRHAVRTRRAMSWCCSPPRRWRPWRRATASASIASSSPGGTRCRRYRRPEEEPKSHELEDQKRSATKIRFVFFKWSHSHSFNPWNGLEHIALYLNPCRY